MMPPSKQTFIQESSILAVIACKNHEYRNLELFFEYHYSNDMYSICNTILFCTPFILYKLPKYAMTVMSFAFTHNLCNSTFRTITSNINYEIKTQYNKNLLLQTYIFRRDEEMANNIITYMNGQTRNSISTSCIPLFIFGYDHYEGIWYYLEKNGYVIVENPKTF